jgi:uncharacterized protein (DUF2062 family)
MTEEHHHHRQLRFAQIRRTKFWLRFMPRRARFHTYPIVGRFADFARKRNYLWSFRFSSLRPAFYAGSILSLMPAMGVQLPLAFVLCLFLRTNFMVMGGLQFITNPVTAGPVYYGTYKLGITVINASGFGRGIDAQPVAPAPETEPATPEHESETSLLRDPETGRPTWTSRIGTGINALILGGLICGLALGAALDLLWRWLVLPAARHHAAKKPVTAVVTPHNDRPPAPPNAT